MPELPLIDWNADAGSADSAEAIADALGDVGACRLANFPDAGLASALRSDLLRLRDSGALREASVGHGASKSRRNDIRGDSTLWLDDPRCGAAAREFLSKLDALREQFNRLLYLGLHEVEAHYAAYPLGAFYKLHRDRFRDSDARRVSLVSYLNDDWREQDGGQLRILLADGSEHIVLPQAATSVVFLSELEHEVLPAQRERLSIAAWMRRPRALESNAS